MNYDRRFNVWPGEPDGHPLFREPLRKLFAGHGVELGPGDRWRTLVPMHTERGRPYARLRNARRDPYRSIRPRSIGRGWRDLLVTSVHAHTEKASRAAARRR